MALSGQTLSIYGSDVHYKVPSRSGGWAAEQRTINTGQQQQHRRQEVGGVGTLPPAALALGTDGVDEARDVPLTLLSSSPLPPLLQLTHPSTTRTTRGHYSSPATPAASSSPPPPSPSIRTLSVSTGAATPSSAGPIPPADGWESGAPVNPPDGIGGTWVTLGSAWIQPTSVPGHTHRSTPQQSQESSDFLQPPRRKYKGLWEHESGRYLGLPAPREKGGEIEEVGGNVESGEAPWQGASNVDRIDSEGLESGEEGHSNATKDVGEAIAGENGTPDQDFPVGRTPEETETTEERPTVTQLREIATRARGEEDKGREGQARPQDAQADVEGNSSLWSHPRPPQQVDLDTLEVELAGKEEEAASDLLLAISILQHRLVPHTSTADDHDQNGTATAQPRLPPPTRRDNPRHNNDFSIEIFDGYSGSEEEEQISEAIIQQQEQQQQHQQQRQQQQQQQQQAILQREEHPEPPESPPKRLSNPKYRWFVLVLDGNCSVIKQRMSAFVMYLKAALSSKLLVDYDDVHVPSVFCDSTFMVNVSLDTLKNPQVESRLRTLAEANTTLLEISQEIFYLEKILTKRSSSGRREGESRRLPMVEQQPDDVELVIYIAVGCMCVFILLSVVVLLLVRACGQEADLAKPHPHHVLPRTLDFPIRRPNVIYSHRFSQSLTQGKCAGCGREDPSGAPSTPPPACPGMAVVAVPGARPSSLFRNSDCELDGDGVVGGDYEDEVYHDRRALVPAHAHRRRLRHVPGEDVILEEDLIEEEEEEEEEDDEEEDEEEEEDLEEVVEEMTRRRSQKSLQVEQDTAAILGSHAVTQTQRTSSAEHRRHQSRAEHQRAVAKAVLVGQNSGSSRLGEMRRHEGKNPGGVKLPRMPRRVRVGKADAEAAVGFDNPCYTR